ncbi:MAG: S9 family peptidase, partial [Candidatus Hodarchaeales archaeon]
MMSIKSEDFVQLKIPNSPALSPDGRKLAFSIKKVNQKKNRYKSPIYLKIEGDNGYKQFTAGTHVDTAPQFSPSGEYLAFLSSRVEKGTQVFIMSVKGGEAVQVTTFPMGVMGFNWSHDSKLIHVLARVNEAELELILYPEKEIPPSSVLEPVEYNAYISKKKKLKTLKTDPRVITEGYCREGTSYLDGRFTQPFIVDISDFNSYSEKQKIMKVIHLGEHGFHFGLGTFSFDDTKLFLSKFGEDPTVSLTQEILQVSVSDPTKRITLGTTFRWVENIQLSPNGKYLSFHSIREEMIYDNTQIFLFDLERAEPGRFICITEDYERSATQSLWFDNNNLIFSSPRNGKININKITINTKEVKILVQGDRNINLFTISNNHNRIAYEVSHVSFPSDIFWCNGDGSEERITQANEEYLETHIPAKAEEFSYEREGVKFQGWLLTPADYDPTKKIPVVLEIHGGPAVMWSPHEKTLWHEWNTLVSQGYAVVFCNPRGSDGYGIDFRAAVFKNWGKTAANDILDSLDTALAKYSFLDSNRVAVTGGSYGGYMTSWLVTQTNRFKAAISQRGVYEFVAFSTTTDIPIWFEKQYEGEIIDRFADIWKDSPVAHVRNLQTPLLIIHSENDFRAPVIN